MKNKDSQIDTIYFKTLKVASIFFLKLWIGLTWRERFVQIFFSSTFLRLVLMSSSIMGKGRWEILNIVKSRHIYSSYNRGRKKFEIPLITSPIVLVVYLKWMFIWFTTLFEKNRCCKFKEIYLMDNPVQWFAKNNLTFIKSFREKKKPTTKKAVAFSKIIAEAFNCKICSINMSLLR